MYKVIGHPRSRALRVIWALEELEQPYKIVPAPPRSEEALRYNPLGKIPALVDEKATLTDSVAIITYLADKHGTLTHKAGTPERAHQDALTQFAVSEIDAALWTKSKHSFILPEDQRIPAAKATAAGEFATAMAQLDMLLGEQEFVAGDDLTIPDIVISHCAGWALSAKFPLPEGRVGAYLKRLRKRPAMGRTLEAVAKHV